MSDLGHHPNDESQSVPLLGAPRFVSRKLPSASSALPLAEEVGSQEAVRTAAYDHDRAIGQVPVAEVLTDVVQEASSRRKWQHTSESPSSDATVSSAPHSRASMVSVDRAPLAA